MEQIMRTFFANLREDDYPRLQSILLSKDMTWFQVSIIPYVLCVEIQGSILDDSSRIPLIRTNSSRELVRKS